MTKNNRHFICTCKVFLSTILVKVSLNLGVTNINFLPTMSIVVMGKRYQKDKVTTKGELPYSLKFCNEMCGE